MRKLWSCSEEDIAFSVKTGTTTVELRGSDTGSDSEGNGEDSCEMVIPKLSRVLENINEVINDMVSTTDRY
jgi:hypothetical protein